MKHRKQIFLFFVAILIPSLALIFFTQKIVRQEKELSVKWADDEYRRRVQEISRALLLRLERLKLEESQNEVTALAHPDAYLSSRPELVMVGLVDESRLFLPWETPPPAPQAIRRKAEGPDIAKMIRDGERAEFEKRDFALAANLYRQALAAPDDEDKEYARLLLARVLAKSGNAAEAFRQFEMLLSLSSRKRDEDGIPLYLYAADRMAHIPSNAERIAIRIGAALEEKPWMSLPEASLVAALLERIAVQAELPDRVKLLVARLRETVGAYRGKAEHLLSVQENFERHLFRLASEGSGLAVNPVWDIEEKGEWLLGLGPLRGRRRLLLVVDIRALNTALLNDEDFRKTYKDEIVLTAAVGSSGDALGPNLNGLYVAHPPSRDGLDAPALGSTRPFYILTMAAVIMFASLGGYLLWRDVRRDLDLAEIRSQFAASVSHELKTPLTAIRMFAETVRLGRLKDEATRCEYLDTIINESERLSRLLSNVLDMSKIEQGLKLYHPRSQALAPIIRTAAKTMEYPLRQKDFSLEMEIEVNLPETRVDADALEQALLNLISNAIKYSGSARAIGLKLLRQGPWAVIQVSDRGVGIPADDRQRIFEKFYRVPSRENEQVPGTGLGLALVAHFVQHHGGRVDVESTPDRGSTFSLYLPLETGP